MLKTRDRLYGELDLPDEVWRLASSCPVLLRLREIRMANIPFFSYPSFANVDRFEHSLGVAHLAWRWARKNRLDDDAALGLTLAALYHDGATPAFGHLFEEYLFRFQWDHESALERLLVGDEELPGRAETQIFLGDYCKLGEVLRRSSPSRTLTPLVVAEIAGGHGELGALIKGDIDLDNIDNVLRASSAMGLADEHDMPHPYDVADSLVLEGGTIRITRARYQSLAAWSSTRHLLYDHILNNPFEFRSQTAFKWAIDVCSRQDKELQSLQSWRLTDPELVFEHLRREPFAAALVDRVRKGRPPGLVFSARIADLGPLLHDAGTRAVTDTLQQVLEARTGMKVCMNYYLDKRYRRIRLEPSRHPVLFEEPTKPSHSGVEPGALGGILGAVGVSQAEFVGSTNAAAGVDTAVGRRVLDCEEIRDILENTLGQEIPCVARGWIGSRALSDQLDLFGQLTSVDDI